MSLDSGNQQNAEPWDAFSNHTDEAPELSVQRPPAYAQAHASPLSPQRQAAAARAKAFIKTQTSNVQSMQVHYHCLWALCVGLLCSVVQSNHGLQTAMLWTHDM